MSVKPKQKPQYVPKQPPPVVNQPAKPFAVPGWAPVAIIICTALLYSRALYNGLTGLDDDFYVVNDPLIRDFSIHGFKAIFTTYVAGNYHPLTMLVYLFIYKLFGLNPLPYHLLNVAVHLANTFLVFKLAGQLSGKKVTALVVALLFAVHPMHVESVAWVSELKDVLYAFFYLSAMLVYLRYLRRGLRFKDYTGVFLLFAASLLCKSAAVTLPVLLIAIDSYTGRKMSSRWIFEKIPLLLLSVAFGIVAINSQKQGGAYNGLMVSYGAINSFFLFTSGLAFYFIWLVAPVVLCSFHYFPALSGRLLPWVYYASLPVVLIIAWLVARRNAYRKEIIFGVAFFLIAISVMLQVVSVGSALTAERYTYISYIGLFYIAGQLISGLVEKKRYRNISVSAFSMFVIVYAAQSWDRIGVWKDDYTLFNDLINKNPDFYYGYWLRGNVEQKDGNPQAAYEDYSRSIELNPSYEDSYYNRGIIENASGNINAAIADYNHSIALNPKQPDAYNSRGWAYYQSGSAGAAIQDYNKAIAIKPAYAEAYNNRAWAYDQAGDAKAAFEDYARAIAINPEYTKPLYNRAALRVKTGDLAGAIGDYNLILKMHPDDGVSYLLRGNAYLGLQNLKSACADWQTAKQMGNKDADGMIRAYCK